MTETIKLLAASDIELIQKIWPAKKYLNPATLFYEGHTPLASYLLIAGSITLMKKKKEPIILKMGSLIGLTEIVNDLGMKASGIICANAKISIIEKSAILEALELDTHHLNSLFEGAMIS